MARNRLTPLLAPILLCLAGLAITRTAHAATLIVRTDGTGDFTTIVSAVAAAAPGDRILIGQGTYSEVVEIFSPVELVAEDPAQPPILSGLGATRPLRIVTPYAYPRTRIENLVFQDGYSSDTGGAIFVTSNSGVVISNCKFFNNRTNFGAGAIHARFNTVVEIDNCHFEGNYARVGGGVATVILGARLNFTDCTFLNNSTDQLGGAIATDEATLTIVRCGFLGNSSQTSAGVINLNESEATIGESTFSLNVSHSRGTIFAERNSSLTVANSILAGDALGFGIGLTSNSLVKATCNIFWQNGLGDFSMSPAVNQDNTTADPLFCDPAAFPLTVRTDSPAIAGTGACMVQIGAYGSDCQAPTAQLAAGVAVVDISDDRFHVSLAVQLAAQLSEVPAVAGLDFQLEWDSSLLDLTSLAPAGAFGNFSFAFNETSGQVVVSMASAAGIAIPDVAAPVVELQFDVLQAFDMTEVGLQIDHCFAEDLSELSVESDNLLLELDPQPCGTGDLNQDSDVNAADAVFLLQVLAGFREESPTSTCEGDLNHSGALDIGDVVLVLQRAVSASSGKLNAASEASVVVAPIIGGVQLAISNAAGMDIWLPENAVVDDVTASVGLQIASASGDHVLWAMSDIAESPVHLELLGVTVQYVLGAQLLLVGGDGLPVAFHISEGPAVDVPSMGGLRLSVFPNPFNPRTHIQLELPVRGDVLATVFDSAGRVLWSETHGGVGPGRFSFAWNGVDLHGVPVASGSYHLVVEALDTTSYRKLALVK